jgi:predicted MFS family arabinose efflux permease
MSSTLLNTLKIDKGNTAATVAHKDENVLLVRILGAAAFLVMFQAYLVAPLIPALIRSFHSNQSLIGLVVPAFTIPYGISSLFYGPLSDRYGRKIIILSLLGFLAISTILLGFSKTAIEFLLLRSVIGVATGGIVPISVALIGDIYPYEKRGKPIGLLFSCMAGGMTFGSTLGAYLNPLIGWPMEFFITGILATLLFLVVLGKPGIFHVQQVKVATGLKTIIKNSGELLNSPKGKKVYSLIFLNGLFHSGIFAWLGYYFTVKYGLNDQGIGIALLGYGLPGMLMGVSIGKAADRVGRRKIVPFGLVIGAFMVLVLAFKTPLWVGIIAVAILSLGYDMTQPLFAGMISGLGNNSTRGQAMGLGSCLLFLGYGIGAIIFQLLLNTGLSSALVVFAVLEIILAIAAYKFFSFNEIS